jgi:autotransporter-associated beta strand protein
MKKRTLKGTREANTMMALVIVTTARLTGPQAQAQTFDVGSVQTINGPVTYNYVSIGIVSAPGTLNVTSDGVLNTSGLFVGDYNVGLLNVDGGTVNANFTLVGYDMQGTINVTNSGTLNTNDLVVGYVSGGLLNVNRGTVTVSGDLTRGSAGTINLNTGGTLQIGNGGTTGTLLGGTGDLENNGTLIFNRSDASSYSGILSGSGAVAKQGTGTLTFSGANTYLGTTTVNAGTLQLSNSLALQNSALDTSGAGVVTLSAVSAPTLGGLIGSTNLADVITGYGNVTALTLNPQSGASNSYLGVIANGADGMTFTKSGAGTQVLSGANTYTGVTTVSAGVLNIQNANALGTIDAGTSVTSGAALQIEGGITTAAEALTLNGTGVSADGALRNISGENTYAGLVTLGEATRINSDAGTLTLSNMGRIQASGSGIGLTVGGAGNTTIAGIETSIGTLTKDGAGTLTLTQSSGFSGGLAVNEGTVRLLTSGYYALNTSVVRLTACII